MLILRSETKHPIDFSLVPVFLILVEFSVLISQLSSSPPTSFGDLFLLRLIHTVTMLVIILLVSQVYIWKNKSAVNYKNLAIVGVLVLAVGDIIHAYMAGLLDIELVELYRRIGIVIVTGGIWFPAIMIVLGQRKELIRAFQDYKQRLVVETRVRSRTAAEFRVLQEATQAQIREELYEKCRALKDSISGISSTSKTLAERIQEIRQILNGDGIREFSRNLQNFESTSARSSLPRSEANSLVVLMQQFRLLHAFTVRSAPLGKWAYILVLTGIAIPPFLYFHSFAELLFSVPVLLGTVYVSATFVTKIQARNGIGAGGLSSILIFLTGLMPLATDSVWQLIFGEPSTQVPLAITAVALPITFFVFMELFQVLRPRALKLLETDQLKASKALQNEVSKILTKEFKGNLSHQWAVYIHGKILTRLASISLKLESASKAESADEFHEAIQNLNSLLGAPDAEFEEESKDLQAELQSRIEPWSGLLIITLSITPEIKSIQNPRVKVLGQVVEELISNSIRHGKATRIDLEITKAESTDLQVVALDDASVAPPKPASSAGLGTRMFNLASDGRWSITRVGLSTEFRLTMSMKS